MNTRLQVEHPVTELVTGIDLVREQITVAAGARLSFSQKMFPGVTQSNAAFTLKILRTTSSPHRDGSQTCKLLQVRAFVTTAASMQLGSSIHYDPMISKLAAWGRDRDEAIDRLRRALDEYHVGGIKTTLPFFRQIVCDAEFVAGKLDTGFIERFQDRLRREQAPRSESLTELQDMADCRCAALLRARAGRNHGDEAVQNRWKMIGRTTGLNARKTIERGSRRGTG